MEFLLFIGGIVALVWGTALLLRGGLLAGCLTLLLAGTCFGHPFFHIPAIIPITLDRLLLVVVLGQSILFRAFGWTNTPKLRGADLWLIAFLGIILANALAHDFAFASYQPISTILFFWLFPAGIYWVARQAPVTERASRAVLAAFAVFGVYLAVMALAEVRGHSALVFPQYIMSPKHVEFYGRGRGPLLNPIGNGLFLSACLASALLLWPTLRGPLRAGVLAVAVVCLAGVYATLTRSVWMGAGMVLLVIGAVSMPRRLRAPALIAILLAGLIGVAANWESLLAFKRDKNMGAQETAESAKLRPLLATVAWQMFLDSPVTGCGFGHYREAAADVISRRAYDMPLESARPYVQHNALLAILADTGLLGLVPFMAFLGLWTRDAWRLWNKTDAPYWARRHGLLFVTFMGAWFANAMFQDVSIIPMVNMLLFFLAGVVQSLSASMPARGAAPQPAAGPF